MMDASPANLTPNDKTPIKEVRNALLESVGHLSADEQRRMTDNMRWFESRAVAAHLPLVEIVDTYQQANRLLQATDKHSTSLQDHQVLADQILQHAAHPTHIDQGIHNTCSVTSLEVRMFMENPGEAAKLIADVGTTGSYTANDGTTVHLSKRDLKKDAESAQNPPIDGARSYASKLFQETALDLNLSDYKLRFLEVPARIGGTAPDSEAVLNRMTGQTDKFPGLALSEIANIERKILGQSNPRQYLRNADTGTDASDLETTFNSEDELKNLLKSAQDSHQMPLTLMVNSSNRAIRPDSNDSEEFAGHFVTVIGYNDRTGMVQFDNQWGMQQDHIADGGIPVRELLEATSARPVQMSKPAQNFKPEMMSSSLPQPPQAQLSNLDPSTVQRSSGILSSN